MYRVGIISNANSRANRLGAPDCARFARTLGTRGELAITTSLAELDRALERHRDAGVEFLGIHGGDGTIHHTLSAAIRIYGARRLPRLIVLRGGTMNTVARGLDIRGPRGAAHALLAHLVACTDAGIAPRTTRRRVVKIGQRHGLIFGNGVMYQFAKAYYDQGQPHRWSGAQLLSRAVLSALVGGPLARTLMRPFTARVTLDGVTWPHDRFLAIAVASVPEAGYGFTPLPQAIDGLDGIAVTGFHTSARGLVAELPRMYFKAALHPERCTVATARQLTITSRAPLGYTIDGDLYAGDTHMDIAAGPEIEIVLPPPA
ncbi:MAG TPA: diacylglycerol kinase family protein [Kofleriaceae bacterium]|jgi:diacylglycerol kinase family enzyme